MNFPMKGDFEESILLYATKAICKTSAQLRGLHEEHDFEVRYF